MRQIIEKNRGERNESFLRKILGARAPGLASHVISEETRLLGIS